MRRVGVTGLGAVTPLGNDARSTWNAAVAGESGIDWIRSFDPGDAPVRIAAEVKDFDATQVAISLGIKGPDYAVRSAYTTGSHAIGEAAELIKRGDADAMLAGGGEACLNPLILAGFTAMRGLAVENEDPPRASRPFDATRA